MPRFYLPPDQCLDPVLFLAGREAHHALHVLRLRSGDRLTVLDGAGHSFLCSVQDHDRDKVRLCVLERSFAPPAPCRITLLQAIPRGKILESIIQKATELGVSRIVPLLSQRVVTRMDQAHAAHKTGKWQSAAIEAVKQCGSPWLPQIEPPLAPRQVLDRNEKFDLPLVASLQDTRQHPRCCFEAYVSQHHRLPASACIWIGPEGDFSPEEMQAILTAGVLPISLGPLVLRAETAAIYCLSFLNYELQTPRREDSRPQLPFPVN